MGDGFGVSMSGVKCVEGITGDLDGDWFPRGDDTFDPPHWRCFPTVIQIIHTIHFNYLVGVSYCKLHPYNLLNLFREICLIGGIIRVYLLLSFSNS